MHGQVSIRDDEPENGKVRRPLLIRAQDGLLGLFAHVMQYCQTMHVRRSSIVWPFYADVIALTWQRLPIALKWSGFNFTACQCCQASRETVMSHRGGPMSWWPFIAQWLLTAMPSTRARQTTLKQMRLHGHLQTWQKHSWCVAM